MLISKFLVMGLDMNMDMDRHMDRSLRFGYFWGELSLEIWQKSKLYG